MEIVKSRYGLDRSIEKLDHETFRVIGESAFGRITSNENEALQMYDFEGGPTYFVGAKLKYGGLNWEVLAIQNVGINGSNLSGCVLKAKPVY
jgi:hypothetical protein